MNPFKSTGLDHIPARFLKDAAVFLKIPITYIINMSIVENKVPEELKSARVVPLYKKGNKSEVGNFRPLKHSPTGPDQFKRRITWFEKMENLFPHISNNIAIAKYIVNTL